MTDITPTSKPTLPSQAYNVLKFIALVLLPALGTLYFAVAQIWGLPKAAEVVGTITVVDTFLGVVLGISSVNYNKNTAENQLLKDKNEADNADGAFVINTDDPQKDTYTVDVGDLTFDDIAQKNVLTLKVKNESAATE